GPTIRSRRGAAVRGGYDENLIFDEPRRLDFKSEGVYYKQLAALPGFQNIRATSSRLVTGEAGLYYTDVRRSRGAVDDEKGVVGDLVANVNYANGKAIPSLRGSYDFGMALPLGHASVWSRNSAGFSQGDRDDPYANFFFG